MSFKISTPEEYRARKRAEKVKTMGDYNSDFLNQYQNSLSPVQMQASQDSLKKQYEAQLRSHYGGLNSTYGVPYGTQVPSGASAALGAGTYTGVLGVDLSASGAQTTVSGAQLQKQVKEAQAKMSVNKKEQSTMGFVKEYFAKHRELFMGLAIAIVLDRYLLGGAFQERLKRIITGLLDKTESALDAPKKV